MVKRTAAAEYSGAGKTIKRRSILLVLLIFLLSGSGIPASWASSEPADSEIAVTSYTFNIDGELQAFARNEEHYLFASEDGTLLTSKNLSSLVKREEIPTAHYTDIRADQCGRYLYAIDDASKIWLWNPYADGDQIVNTYTFGAGLQPVSMYACSEAGIFVLGSYDNPEHDSDSAEVALFWVTADGKNVDKFPIADRTELAPHTIKNVGDAMFVVGQGRYMYRADSLTDWQSITLPEKADYVDIAGPEGGPIVVVASDKNNLYVAQQTQGAWETKAIASPVGNGKWSGVAYGDGYYIAVGKAGQAIFSKDGGDWTVLATGTSEDLLSIDYRSSGGFTALGKHGSVLQFQVPAAGLETVSDKFDKSNSDE